jgi:trehalose 6-phosphate synthase
MPTQVKRRSTDQTPSPEEMHADRLIIVTNRGPIEFYESRDRSLGTRRGSGGVVTALLGALEHIDATWVSLAMSEADRRAVREEGGELLAVQLDNRQMRLRYVVVPQAVYRNHYDIICNRVLWFLQHYFADREGSLSQVRLQYAWEHGYQAANQALAEAVCAELAHKQGSAVVMLHDYHLYLAPALIRSSQPQAVIQQFIHIPWPEIRYWQSFLPTALLQAIFKGLLGNDIVGFQTRRDAQNFLEGARTFADDAVVDVEVRAISWQGHRTLVRDYPISISVSDERRLVQSRAGKKAAVRVEELFARQTIMRVDRIEPTKNIVQGFHAYGRLLELHPELRGEVTFLAFLVPSRQSLRMYRRYRTEVQNSINEVNDRFGQGDWIPIHAFMQNDRLQALVAMQDYDVLLVNPLIDGMNLVAKEGPAVNKRDGVLVLSRTSGAFQQLEGASIPISPADTQETAVALYTALTLPAAERHRKAQLAAREVERANLATWIAQQVRDINQALAECQVGGSVVRPGI